MSEQYDDLDELPAPPRKDIPAADRELLELAARALGAVRIEEVDGEGYLNLHLADGSIIYAWNSLAHSDDAFELVVKLGLSLDIWGSQSKAMQTYENRDVYATEAHGDDPSSATRRAVTRAAAEVWRATQ